MRYFFVPQYIGLMRESLSKMLGCRSCRHVWLATNNSFFSILPITPDFIDIWLKNSPMLFTACVVIINKSWVMLKGQLILKCHRRINVVMFSSVRKIKVLGWLKYTIYIHLYIYPFCRKMDFYLLILPVSTFCYLMFTVSNDSRLKKCVCHY